MGAELSPTVTGAPPSGLRGRRGRTVLFALASTVVLLVVAGPRAVALVVEWRLRAAIADAGFEVAPGAKFELDVLEGENRSSFAMERRRDDQVLKVAVDEARLVFDFRELFLADEPRLREVTLDGPSVEIARLKRMPPGPEQKMKELAIDRLSVRRGEVRFVDIATGGAPVRIRAYDVRIDREATLRGASARLALSSQPMPASVSAPVALAALPEEATLEVTPIPAPGSGAFRIEIARLPLAPLSPYCEASAGIAVRAGRGRAVAYLRELPQARGYAISVHIEIEGLKVEGGAQEVDGGLGTMLSARAALSYLGGRAPFFAQDFEAFVPAAALTGLPGHDIACFAEAIGRGLLEAFVRDRVDFRDPPALPLHPEVAEVGELSARYPGLKLVEVFAGCLKGRVVPQLAVRVGAVDPGGLLSRGEAALHGVAGRLRVEVRGARAKLEALARGTEVVLENLVIAELIEDPTPRLVLKLR
jgi:hypothetical protein